MCSATLLLLAALPALAGRAGWCADGEVVSVLQEGVGVGGAGRAGGVSFAPNQSTSVVAPAGHAATLDCRVLRLHDKSVSWVRSRDLQILSHAGVVFTADARVSAAASPPGGAGGAGSASRHTLTIERLRASDAGRYECQVNTEPKMSLFFNLTVVDEPLPVVVVAALGGAARTGAAGGAATLACEARYSPPPRALPLPPLDVRWYHAGQPLSLQGLRGGVSLDTERWQWRVVSRLTLADLTPSDAGLYTCSAGDVAATLTLTLYDTEDHAEAMQRDQASGAAAPSARLYLRLLSAALCTALVCTARPR